MSQIRRNDRGFALKHGSSEVTCDLAPLRPIGATLSLAPNYSGHIDPRVERYRDNPAGVFKLTAIQVHFLAMSEIARIRLIWRNWRQRFHRRI